MNCYLALKWGQALLCEIAAIDGNPTDYMCGDKAWKQWDMLLHFISVRLQPLAFKVTLYDIGFQWTRFLLSPCLNGSLQVTNQNNRAVCSKCGDFLYQILTFYCHSFTYASRVTCLAIADSFERPRGSPSSWFYFVTVLQIPYMGRVKTQVH